VKIFFLIYGVLSKKSKKFFWVVLIASTIGMGLEVIGIGMIMPMIEILIRPEMVDDNSIWYKLLNTIGEKANFTLIGLSLVVFLFIFKNLYLALQVSIHSKFTFDVQVETSSFLFENYLGKPYEFFLITNSSELLRNTVAEVNSFVGYVLQPLLIIISECMVLLAVVFLLLYVEPFACAFAILFVGSLGWLFNRFTSERVKGWGNERQKREGMKIQCLQEGFNGIKVLKLINNNSFINKNFTENTRLGANAGQHQYAMQQMPRLLFETLAVLGLAILVIGLSRESNTQSLLPKLGMIAFGLVRVMPSVARIINSSQSIVYGWPSVQVLQKELHNWTKQEKVVRNIKPLEFNKSFKLENVSYAYPKADQDSLNNVTINLSKGTCVGIIGESGSGKSTIVDIALGLLKPRKGKILLDGKEISGFLNHHSWSTMVGYVPQEIFLTDSSLRSNIAFGLEPAQISDERVWQCLEDANLKNFIKNLPEGLDTMMGERGTRLSGGQRQRVGIARALYRDPELIVFDEATSALDSESEDNITNTIYSLRKKKSFIIVAHRLSTLKNCDLVYKFKDGSVEMSGSFESVTA
jgi:ABC-type bacteriocin/lantibiotic exporter with double-glycine peptidase domain